ncbi:hypothetical protein SAVIM40S_07713 [Streptomyces avidinii]
MASTPVTTSIRSLMLFPVIAARCSSANVTSACSAMRNPSRRSLMRAPRATAGGAAVNCSSADLVTRPHPTRRDNALAARAGGRTSCSASRDEVVSGCPSSAR